MSSKATVIGGKLKLKGDTSKSLTKRTPAVANSVGQKRALDEGNSFNSSSINNSNSDKDASGAVAPSSSSSSSLLEKDDTLTEAQRRFKQKRLEREKQDVKKISEVSFRERIEKFNEKLSKLTEHNDIPRVSAAGNG